MKPPLAVGCDAGGSAIKAALVDANGRVHAFLLRRWTPGRRAIAPRIARVIETLKVRAGTDWRRVVGIGIAVPGWLDATRGALARADNLPGAVGEPVRHILARRFRRPVVLEADTNAALLGECAWGAGAGIERVLILAAGTGVGAALAVAGEPVRVAHHVTAHVAHVYAGPASIPCACGRRGCAQATLSAGGLVARARRAACARTTATAHDVFRRAGEGDARCARALRAYARDLGRFLGELSNLFTPDAVIFAGGLSGAWPAISDTARASFARAAIAPVPRLLPAKLGRRAGALGAAAAAFRLPWDERLARMR